MKRSSQVLPIVLASLALAACEDVTAPENVSSAGLNVVADLGGSGGSHSAQAVLSSDLVAEGFPVTFSVDFGFGFSSISQVDYSFTFGDDPLDPGECLLWRVGICNVFAEPQTSRLLTVPCPGDPAACEQLLDGIGTEQVTASTYPVTGTGAVRITSLIITVHGTARPRSVDQCKLGNWQLWGFENQGQCVAFVEAGREGR